MAKKTSDYFVESETGNWNMSANYIEDLHIKLKTADHYRTACKFGVGSLYENLVGLNIPRDVQQIEAMKWFCETLRELSYDVLPCIKRVFTKPGMEKIAKKLTVISEKISNPATISNTKNDFTTNTSIQTINSNFKIVLRELENMKMEITDIMNKNDLIFSHRTEFNHKDFKAAIKDRIRTKG